MFPAVRDRAVTLGPAGETSCSARVSHALFGLGLRLGHPLKRWWKLALSQRQAVAYKSRVVGGEHHRDAAVIALKKKTPTALRTGCHPHDGFMGSYLR